MISRIIASDLCMYVIYTCILLRVAVDEMYVVRNPTSKVISVKYLTWTKISM